MQRISTNGAILNFQLDYKYASIVYTRVNNNLSLISITSYWVHPQGGAAYTCVFENGQGARIVNDTGVVLGDVFTFRLYY